MKLAGTSSGYVEGLPDEVQRRIRALKNLNVRMQLYDAIWVSLFMQRSVFLPLTRWQLEHIELENQFKAEITELEKKYLKLYNPLYEKV